MSARAIQTVILDVGGVIFEDAIEPKMRDLAMKYSIPIPLLRKEKRSLRRPVDLGLISEAEFWRRLIKAGGATPDRDDLEFDRYIVAVPGAIAALEQLSTLYQLALLTNDSIDLARARRAHLPIEICPAIVSAELGIVKPDPEIYHYALRKIKSPPNACVFIDDSKGNVMAAERIGIVGLRFRSWQATLVQLGLAEADPAS